MMSWCHSVFKQQKKEMEIQLKLKVVTAFVHISGRRWGSLSSCWQSWDHTCIIHILLFPYDYIFSTNSELQVQLLPNAAV